jgi:hypothetical protein
MLTTIATAIQGAPKGIKTDWRLASMSPQQAALLARECTQPSEFDEILSKQQLYRAYQDGQIQPYIVEHSVTKDVVIALFPEPESVADVPWGLWSQIMQLFRRPNHQPHTIFLLGHPAIRHFPVPGKLITPYHINGGYTYPCNADCVFIFRAEDATRVLLHELFHSNCCDNTQLTLEEREAETEAWAELFWCGLLSRGNLKSFKSLVAEQGSLIRSQNRRLQEGHHMKKEYQGFPWRYTVGKELLWSKWDLLQGTTDKMDIGNSMRLTVHPTEAMKKSFGVTSASTML